MRMGQFQIELCAKKGIDRQVMQDFMDYQTSLDFVISNTDEHLLNFGILRNSESLIFLAPSPIYDNGNSMFYNENVIYNRATILTRSITAFHKKEEKMLKHIRNKQILKSSLLPSPSDVKAFYERCDMPEKKLNVIVKNYEIKLKLFHDFQNGISISYYNEKKKR